MKPSPIFEKTYKDYLSQIEGIDFQSVRERLGACMEGKEMVIRLLNEPYRISGAGIVGPSGKKPSLDVCIILSRYVIMCPDDMPTDRNWASFRDFRDSGPLTVYFANDVERPVATRFRGKTNELKSAGETIGGHPPDDTTLAYDLTMRFDFLPNMAMLILFNDADAEFPATCSILFEHRAEKFLDAECLGMAGKYLTTRLKKAVSSI